MGQNTEGTPNNKVCLTRKSECCTRTVTLGYVYYTGVLHNVVFGSDFLTFVNCIEEKWYEIIQQLSHDLEHMGLNMCLYRLTTTTTNTTGVTDVIGTIAGLKLQ